MNQLQSIIPTSIAEDIKECTFSEFWVCKDCAFCEKVDAPYGKGSESVNYYECKCEDAKECPAVIEADYREKTNVDKDRNAELIDEISVDDLHSLTEILDGIVNKGKYNLSNLKQLIMMMHVQNTAKNDFQELVK